MGWGLRESAPRVYRPPTEDTLNTPPHKTMRQNRAAQLLADILKWKIDLETPKPITTQSHPTDNTPIHNTNPDTLPFGYNQIFDTTWTDGPEGLTTPAGVDKWIGFWTPWLAYWTDTQPLSAYRLGTWLLTQLEESRMLADVEDWTGDDKVAWGDFTDELYQVWARVGRLTGRRKEKVGPCPKCWTSGDPEKRVDGYLYAPWDPKKGRATTWKCSTCDYEVDEAHYSAELIRHIQDIKDGTAWVDAAWLREAIPTLDQRKLRVWKSRGRVDWDPTTKKYRLTDITTCLGW